MSKEQSDQPTIATFHTLAFATREAAEHAYSELRSMVLAADHISLVVRSEPTEKRGANVVLDHDIDVGGAVGAGAGSLAAGMGGLLAGLGLLVIPGFGPLLAVGPIAGAITGAITGGALGGFAGSLIGVGVAEASALRAENHLAAGRSIIIVTGAAWSEHIEAIACNLAGLVGIDQG